MDNLTDEIKKNPMIYIFMAVICTALTVFGTTTFATMGYVDNKTNEIKKDVKDHLKSINDSIKTLNSNVLNLYKRK